MNKNSNNQVDKSEQDVFKCRFFAQYWGQIIFRLDNSPKYALNAVNRNVFLEVYKNGFLMLKPLSKITNEDAVEAIKIFKVYRSRDGSFITEHCPVENIKNIFLDIPIWRLDVADFLRSKGYALPFFGYSVDDLIEMGWVQLI